MLSEKLHLWATQLGLERKVPILDGDATFTVNVRISSHTHAPNKHDKTIIRGATKK